ncbi:hypothetical protein LshimejAT787_0700240 [Lyophyllum shimeji]|uniref:Uncharacterized protein n=1 Tax=Lyophyllum shimeji TaxID=47721 RepID=A0A9P3PQ28_LYOSH|nr:hypothetical protein LshimejAT787_0700240 [Lyophyllum shimeji]
MLIRFGDEEAAPVGVVASEAPAQFDLYPPKPTSVRDEQLGVVTGNGKGGWEGTLHSNTSFGLGACSLTDFLRENVYKPPIDALKAPGSAPTTKSKQYLHYRSIPASQCASRSLPLPPCSPSLQAPTPPPSPMKLMRRRRSARSKEKSAPRRSSLAARLTPAAGSEGPASNIANGA